LQSRDRVQAADRGHGDACTHDSPHVKFALDVASVHGDEGNFHEDGDVDDGILAGGGSRRPVGEDKATGQGGARVGGLAHAIKLATSTAPAQRGEGGAALLDSSYKRGAGSWVSSNGNLSPTSVHLAWEGRSDGWIDGGRLHDGSGCSMGRTALDVDADGWIRCGSG
jgi:hypothetical protein